MVIIGPVFLLSLEKGNCDNQEAYVVESCRTGSCAHTRTHNKTQKALTFNNLHRNREVEKSKE